MGTHKNAAASEDDERESIILKLEEIDGIGRKTAEAMYKSGIHSYADLAQFLSQHTTAKEISEALRKHGINLSPGFIDREKWIRSLSNKQEHAPLSLPVEETETIKKSEEPPPSQKTRDHDTEFTVFFDVVRDKDGKPVLHTTVYDPKDAGEEKEFEGSESSPWVNWMLERANLPIGIEQPEVLPEAEVNAAAPSVPAEPYDAQITISNVQLTTIEPAPQAPENRLRAEISFQLSGTDAEALAFNVFPYRISIYTIEFVRGTPAIVTSKDGQFEPYKFEYTYKLEFAEPAVGRYEFHSVVRLPPSGNLMGYHQGPIITISSSPHK